MNTNGKIISTQTQARKQVLPGNDGSTTNKPEGNGSAGKPESNGSRAATPADNIVSKDEISGLKGKRTSVYDTGTGRDFRHYNISTLGETNSEGYPQTIKLKADRGWNNQTMTFVGIKDGVAVYSIGTGKLTDGKHQEYRLEKVGGEIKFTQREGDIGYNKANWNTDG